MELEGSHSNKIIKTGMGMANGECWGTVIIIGKEENPRRDKETERLSLGAFK